MTRKGEKKLYNKQFFTFNCVGICSNQLIKTFFLLYQQFEGSFLLHLAMKGKKSKEKPFG